MSTEWRNFTENGKVEPMSAEWVETEMARRASRVGVSPERTDDGAPSH